MATKTKWHRGFKVEITETANGFEWECKTEDGKVIATFDNKFSFPGDDVDDAFDYAKEAINDFLED